MKQRILSLASDVLLEVQHPSSDDAEATEDFRPTILQAFRADKESWCVAVLRALDGGGGVPQSRSLQSVAVQSIQSLEQLLCQWSLVILQKSMQSIWEESYGKISIQKLLQINLRLSSNTCS
mmetsp:Transcript_10364/g.13716  ORF Transcript_10364/g.13716 Transcript_10364/m.13716 type:complete len:122 (+) Transcript_10364:1142-1507(+)|eukprot:CAMPEP_0198139060 /NCGR_PEP_ID=MMETSP1443-20131203/2399_1 /TAXON_ID=186043 /ORGANISM="Entomoneis sp., Strain CCMP2396" /LENGTH=121 /DNA_ID=CAMNT_0043801059 /DNA_START=1057 /DNA_END=1422 /DNA_ORIENTATION=-